MNRLPEPTEKTVRKPGWIEGEWITLADGQSWSFPPPGLVPGYSTAASEASRMVVDKLMPFLNIDAVRRHTQQALDGDPSAVLRDLGQMLALYQIVFWAGSALLQANYDVADADCDRLMPFNYQLGDLAVPDSRIHRTTPEVLAMSNAIVAASGIDIGPILERITSSN
jgi:hypothetical protein